MEITNDEVLSRLIILLQMTVFRKIKSDCLFHMAYVELLIPFPFVQVTAPTVRMVNDELTHEETTLSNSNTSVDLVCTPNQNMDQNYDVSEGLTRL